MSSGHVAVIGFGSIGRDLVQYLTTTAQTPPSRLTVLVRDARVARTRAALGRDVRVTSDLAHVLNANPDVVAECAGHTAVATYGPEILRSGTDLVVASVGALAKPEVMATLSEAAAASGAQCVVPAGAIGGIDGLSAARLSGLTSVAYTGRKPPSAWAGTPAEASIDLSALTGPTPFFEGSARAAAQAYPKNANVAATVALAGAGMDDTVVRLIADPTIRNNVHELSVTSSALDFSIRLTGKPSARNAKTSQSTVFSIARAILNRRAAIRI